MIASQAPEADFSPTRDTFPYRHRVGEIMTSPVVDVPLGSSLRDAARTMARLGVSSVLVRDGGRHLGIVTEHDVLTAVTEGIGTVDRPVDEVMSSPLVTIPADAFVFQAIGRLDRINARHLPVTGSDGSVVGMVSARTLLRQRAGRALAIGDCIEVAETGEALSRAWTEVAALAPELRDDGMTALAVAALISRVLREMTARAATLAERELTAEGRPAPAPYAVLVLGSGGRGESLLKPDQDNALVFDGDAGLDPWFAELGERMCGLLDTAGIPYCRGGVMARNPEWRGNLAQWSERAERWIRARRPEDLLNVDIFFDGVAVYGRSALADRLRSIALETAARSSGFLRGLALQLSGKRPPLGWAPFGIGGWIRTVQGRADLKLGGTMPLVAAARVLALRDRIGATATVMRLRAAAEAGNIAAEDGEQLSEALETIMAAILDQQIADRAAGHAPTTRVEIARLPRARRRALVAALQRVDEVQAMAEASLDPRPLGV